MTTERNAYGNTRYNFAYYIFFTFLPQIFRVQIFANKEKFDNMLNNDNFAINILQAFEIKTKFWNDNNNNNKKK